MADNKFLVVDLEASCWRGRPPKGQFQEIIEIGIAAINVRTREIEPPRSILIKPAFSEISEFCTKLTTIDQELLDKDGVTWAEALHILETEVRAHKYGWGAWGHFDKRMFQDNSELYETQYPMNRQFIDIKELHAFKYGMNRGMGIKGATEKHEMEWEGIHHRAHWDAYNTAKVFNHMLPVEFLK